jgi:hypothetical protein
MNEKVLATHPRGFLRTNQMQVFRCMRTEFLGERRGRINQTAAAERRQNTAHGVSRGLNRENEKAPEGRKKFALVAAAEGDFRVILRFTLHSGRGETMAHHHALMYVPANTGSTVGFHLANCSPRNERDIPCI